MKKPKLDVEDVELYYNEIFLKSKKFNFIKKIKVNEILKEEYETSWNPITKTLSNLGMNVKVRITVYMPKNIMTYDENGDVVFKTPSISEKVSEDISNLDTQIGINFFKKYLNYPLVSLNYEGKVDFIDDDDMLRETIKKFLKTL